MLDSFLSWIFILPLIADCDDDDGKIGDNIGRLVAVFLSRGTTLMDLD